MRGWITAAAASLLMLSGCDSRTPEEIEEARRLGGFNTVVIDSCEYLIQSPQGELPVLRGAQD